LTALSLRGDREMGKFKVGDRVRVVGANPYLVEKGAGNGTVQTIAGYTDARCVLLAGIGCRRDGGNDENRFELVTEKSTAALTAEAHARGEGYKADAGKPDWTLFPFDGAEEVVRVLELGAEKYARDNWRSVPDAINRYRKAGLRHRIADALGEANDPETGKSHLAHSVCCDLFVLALLRAEKKTP
jgi:hypothetical protein